MIKSMTGFGRAVLETESLSVKAEVKSLNSKYSDTTIRISNVFSGKEIEVKGLVAKKLERGKVNLNVTYVSKRPDLISVKINKPLVSSYFTEMQSISQELGDSGHDLFRLAMMMPDAYLRDEDEEALEQDWVVVKQAINEAIEQCDEFRAHEGEHLSKLFESYVHNIDQLLSKVIALDPERLEKVRERIKKQVSDFENSENFDANRFEQELIYYVEKLDITEEKTRLKKHLTYFTETLKGGNGSSKGKKLNFVAQEIGREINTIGSKANHAEIQKLVVNMKDELEKIKEQLYNVL